MSTYMYTPVKTKQGWTFYQLSKTRPMQFISFNESIVSHAVAWTHHSIHPSITPSIFNQSVHPSHNSYNKLSIHSPLIRIIHPCIHHSLNSSIHNHSIFHYTHPSISRSIHPIRQPINHPLVSMHKPSMVQSIDPSNHLIRQSSNP